jgi:hypothetical protein
MAIVGAPTWQDLYDQVRAYASGVRPTMKFMAGMITDIFAGGVANAGDRIVAYIAQTARDTTLNGSRGEALRVLANDHWNVQWNPGAAATVTLTISRVSGALSGTIAAGTEFRTQPDALGRALSFRLNSPLAWAAQTSQTASATAAGVGIDYNVGTSEITVVGGPLFDVFTVTNATIAAGGADP